jgi:hypothetical protein
MELISVWISERSPDVYHLLFEPVMPEFDEYMATCIFSNFQ